MWLIFLACILAYIIYVKCVKPMKYWKEKGVPYVEPVPICGNMSNIILQRRANVYVVQDIYKQFSDKRYFGFYNFSTPVLIIRDPDLIKQITVKEFDTFPEHRRFIADGVDPLWSNNLFAMRGGQKWHDMRSTLSPSFTSNKMKMMFKLMKECSKQFSDHFLNQNKMVTVEMKDAFTRFTNDVIATTAFGVTCDSLRERDNEFYLMGKEATDFSGIKGLKFAVHFLSPALGKLLKLRIFTKKVGTFFTTLIKDAMKIREEKGIVRPDMIHLLMEAKKGHLKHDENKTDAADSGFAVAGESETPKLQKRQKTEITDEDIAAQALIFFFAGFESVSTMMCFASHELAVNPDIQEKLRIEVDETLKKYNGELTYEALTSMKYLDMVITETLRKWPSFGVGDRRSVKPFTIEPVKPDEKPLHLEAGSICIFPVYSIQRDPEYYPNPEKFDPERYNDSNKHNVNPFTFLSFGAGPRNCIGSRFALIEGKLIIAEIISKFEIVPVEKTPIPLKLGKRNFNPLPDEGFWLGLKPRQF